MLLVRRVVGKSMAPTLQPGRLVFARKPRSIRPGDIILFRQGPKEYIKRVDRINNDRLFVLGDNQELSTDSREFGWLDMSTLVAKVVWPRT